MLPTETSLTYDGMFAPWGDYFVNPTCFGPAGGRDRMRQD
jgi:hypothetical protein